MLTEERIEGILRNSDFTNDRHKEALWDQLRSMPGELSVDDLEKVAGGVTVTADFELMDYMPGSIK